MSDRGEPTDEPVDPTDLPAGEGWSGAVDRPGGTGEPSAASGSGIPGFDELMRALGALGGGPQGTADFEAMVRSVFGENATLPPELTSMFAALQGDPATNPMAAMLRRQMDALFAAQSPQQRLDTARDIARKVLSMRGDRAATDREQQEASEAVHVASLWVDPVTALGSSGGTGSAWSGAQWVEATMPTWYSLVEPVADGVTRAASTALRAQVEQLGGASLPEGLGGLLGQIAPAVEQLSAGLFAAQLGQAVGSLATDVLSGTEVGLPLVPHGTVALLPARVTEFAEGLQIDPAQVRLYLAVREAARVRLFAQAPWLGSQLEAAVRDYGRHITIDTDAIESAIRSVDLSDLGALQDAFAQGQLFAPTTTPEQQAALNRLEATLALVEGWVDLVTEQAVAAHLPQAEALGEAVRRRRAGGPAQKLFASLVGLELRPRRLKDARNLWAALEQAGGVELRDGSWQHLDLAPTATDLDDPLGYVDRRTRPPVKDALDAELDALLSGETKPSDDPGATGPE